MNVKQKIFFGKFEKGSDRLIGYLSKGKRRWLPEISKHQHLILKTPSEIDAIIKEYKDQYGWQHTYQYYFKPVSII